MTRARSHVWHVLPALLPWVAACGEDFAPYQRLESLRVLAIGAEPAAPGPGETTTLTPLVYTRAGEPVTGSAWSWCPFAGPASNGYPCLVTEDQLRAMGAPSVPSFDLGGAPTATLAHTIEPAILAALCKGAPGAPVVPDCAGGFPVQIKLRVTTAKDEIVAVRTLRLRFDPAMPTEANASPRLEGLTAEIGGDVVPLLDDPAPTVTLPRGAKTTLHAQVAEDAAETYVALDDAGQPAPRRETLALTWFVESGVTRSPQTSFIDGVVTLDKATTNTWTPAKSKDYHPDTARLVVVLRDNRGGVAWRAANVRLEATP